MVVVIRYFANLRELRGIEVERVELPAGSTAGSAYAFLGLPQSLPVAFAVNAVRVASSTALNAEDELVFLPPIGGG